MASPITEKAQEWEWKVEDAARALKESAKVKRDKKLLKAARAYLKQEIVDAQKAIKAT